VYTDLLYAAHFFASCFGPLAKPRVKEHHTAKTLPLGGNVDFGLVVSGVVQPIESHEVPDWDGDKQVTVGDLVQFLADFAAGRATPMAMARPRRQISGGSSTRCSARPQASGLDIQVAELVNEVCACSFTMKDRLGSCDGLDSP
jgi:hypothetical protein